MHVSKLFACVWVIFLVLVGHAYTGHMISQLLKKGFSLDEIRRTERYLNAFSSSLTESEQAEAKARIETEEKRLGRKLTKNERANYEAMVKKEARDLYDDSVVKRVLEAAKEAAKEDQEHLKLEEESASVKTQRWLSDHTDTILTVNKTIYWMFGALSVGLILGYLLGRSSVKGRSKNKDRPSEVDPSGNADPAHSP